LGGNENQNRAARGLEGRRQAGRPNSAFDGVDFDGFDLDAVGFEPSDGIFDDGPFSVKFQGDNADGGRDGSIPDIEGDVKLTAHFANERSAAAFGAKSQPKTLLFAGHRGFS